VGKHSAGDRGFNPLECGAGPPHFKELNRRSGMLLFCRKCLYRKQ
jgi:hypothetical protein